MKFVYTLHAAARMKKRELKPEWVERVAGQPARIEDDPTDATLEHRLAPIAELENRVLRVILSRDKPHRIVTVHLDRRMKGQP